MNPNQAADTSPDQLASPPGGTIRSGEDGAREAVEREPARDEAASHPSQAADKLLGRLELIASQSEIGQNLAGTPQVCRAAITRITELEAENARERERGDAWWRAITKEAIARKAVEARAAELEGALREQVANCFDPTCQLCTRHEAILTKKGTDDGR